ncbi:MAG TPA: hypothetical protein VIG51_08240 [Candidatus Baltobacteraceae bacterium]
MAGLSHIVLHVALCRAASRELTRAPLDLRVVMAYRVRKPEMDQKFTIPRGTSGTATVEFDAPQGIYRLMLATPKPAPCSGVDYVAVLPDHDRDVSATLYDGAAQPMTSLVVAGDRPSYIHMAVMMFDGRVTCGGPVGNPAADAIDNVTGPGAYYASIYSPASAKDPKSRVVAMQIMDSSGGYHYLHVPTDFPQFLSGWPQYQRYDVTMDVVQYAATKPEDTLLCPPLNRTSAY